MLGHYLLHMTSYNNARILLTNIHDNCLLIVVVAHLVHFFSPTLGISSIRFWNAFILMGTGSFIIIMGLFVFRFGFFIQLFLFRFMSCLYCFKLIYCLNLLLNHLSLLLEVTPLAHIFIATTHKTA